MKKLEGEVKEILDLAGSVVADKGFQGSGYVTPAKKPQGRELYTREHEYNNQVSSIRAPIERAVAHLKTWKILTKKIHASRSAAANLIHALACGYARGGDAGLAVAGPGILPGPQRVSDGGWFGRDVTSGVQAC